MSNSIILKKVIRIKQKWILKFLHYNLNSKIIIKIYIENKIWIIYT
jgi:hypothetical protein